MSSVRKPTQKDRNGDARTSGGWSVGVWQRDQNRIIDEVGCELNVKRVLLEHQPKDALYAIDDDLASAEQRIPALLQEVTT